MQIATRKPNFTPPQQVEITRTWEEPVTESKRLGSIPDDYFESAWYPGPYYGNTYGTSSDTYFHGNSTEGGNTAIYRDVPVYDSNGKPKMHSVTETLKESSYNEKTSTLVSGGVGAGLGMAAGAGLLAAFSGGAAGGAGMVISGLVGAAAGGATGAFIGNKAADGDKVEERWKTAEILHPSLSGYRHEIDPDIYYQQECHTEHKPDGSHQEVCNSVPHLRGYNHNYQPLISNRVVGSYKYPTLEHTNKLGPVLGGVLAGVAGAGAGTLVALAAHLL